MSALPTPEDQHGRAIPPSVPSSPTPGRAEQPPQPARDAPISIVMALAGVPDPDRPTEANQRSLPMYYSLRLHYPTLHVAAALVDDLEQVRIAAGHRLRILTLPLDVADEDGVYRGHGIPEDERLVVTTKALVEQLSAVEHGAQLALKRAMRAHPLGPWVAASRGVGEQQAARLLAAIGDPYWNTLHNRPRTKGELIAYCGLHTLPADQANPDTQRLPVGGAQSSGSDPSHVSSVHHSGNAWVAARRQKGQKSNWSTTAKMRAWNIAVSCVKSGGPYREVYDRRREVTAERVHATPCVRCGPAGKPAQPGSPWSKGHQHADGLRIASKEMLKDLWKAARDLHLAAQSQPLPSEE